MRLPNSASSFLSTAAKSRALMLASISSISSSNKVTTKPFPASATSFASGRHQTSVGACSGYEDFEFSSVEGKPAYKLVYFRVSEVVAVVLALHHHQIRCNLA